MSNTIQSGPNKVQFSQTQCGICLVNYKQGDVIQKLACNHLFHPDCLLEQIVRCPVCKTSIEGRDKTYTRDEIEKLTSELFEKLFKICPSMRQMAAREQTLTDYLNTEQNDPDRSLFYSGSGILQLQKLNKILSFLVDEKTCKENYQNLLPQFTFAAVEFILRSYEIEPFNQNELLDEVKEWHRYLSLKELLLKKIEKSYVGVHIPIIKVGFILRHYLLDFFKNLRIEIVKDPRIIELFQRQQKEFAELRRPHFQSNNFFSKMMYLKEHTPKEIQVLTKHIPEARRVRRMMKVMRVASSAIIMGAVSYLAYEVAKRSWYFHT